MAETDADDLDFTRTPRRRTLGYDPSLTRTCFDSLGTEERMVEGGAFFVENQPTEKIYLLVEGEVNLRRGARSLDIVKPGEIFGELAALTHQPRSASAVARTPCRAIALSARQLRRAIQETPEFGFMLMNTMVARLRVTVTMLNMTKSLPDWRRAPEIRVFDDKLMATLMNALPERTVLHYPAEKVIMRENEGGVFMYVVLEGRVLIFVGSQVVERVGPGGVFGEMALVDQSTRAATAVAETECELLPVNRSDLLDLTKNRPEIGMSLLKAIAERLRYMDTGYR